MKKIIYFLTLVLISSFSFGFYQKSISEEIGNKIIGYSVLVLVFVYLPIFIYNGWKNKSIEDYMLSNDKLKKMRGKSLESKK